MNSNQPWRRRIMLTATCLLAIVTSSLRAAEVQRVLLERVSKIYSDGKWNGRLALVRWKEP